MAGTFSPFGLRYANSLSTSNNSTDGFREYELDPTFSGYAGDLAVPFIGDVSVFLPTSDDFDPIAIECRSSKFIYPCPALFPTGTGLPNPDDISFEFLSMPPLLGVFASFEYVPLGGDGQVVRRPYYVQNTAKPGTPVIAKVICDPLANYDIQFRTDGVVNTTGIPQTYLFSGGFPYCDTGYFKIFTFEAPSGAPTPTITAPFWFPTGNDQGSLSYLALGAAFNDLLQSDTTPSNYTPEAITTGSKGWGNDSTLIINGLAKDENNKWANPAQNILAPNNIVQVSLTQSYALQSTYFRVN